MHDLCRRKDVINWRIDCVLEKNTKILKLEHRAIPERSVYLVII